MIATSNNHNQLMIGKYLPCKFLGSDVAFWNSKSSEASDEELFPADSVENVLSIEKVHALLLSRPMHNLNKKVRLQCLWWLPPSQQATPRSKWEEDFQCKDQWLILDSILWEDSCQGLLRRKRKSQLHQHQHHLPRKGAIEEEKEEIRKRLNVVSPALGLTTVRVDWHVPGQIYIA